MSGSEKRKVFSSGRSTEETANPNMSDCNLAIQLGSVSGLSVESNLAEAAVKKEVRRFAQRRVSLFSPSGPHEEL